MKSLFTIVLALFNTVFRGYLIKTLWAWFIVTQFPSLPTISILPAIGFSCFVGAISPWKEPTQKDLEDSAARTKDSSNYNLLITFAHTIAIFFSLAVSWVVHLLMLHWG